MKFNNTWLAWVCKIELPYSSDMRWDFTKTFHSDTFQKTIWYTPFFKESFFTQSYKWVIRGMHFQLPPSDLDKLVYVTEWSILDVVLDLRRGESYGKYISEELTRENHYALFIPKWIAHGFLTLSDVATVHYLTTEVYNSECDSWISWNSFWFNWNWIIDPIVSSRDQSHLSFSTFESPF